MIPEKMKAIVISQARTAEVREITTPKPAEGEILVRVEKCLICTWEQRIFAGTDMALPFVPGHEISGTVAAIGEGTFATVVAIRDKLRRGKKLEPWELSYYRAHRDQVDLRPARSAAEQAEHDRLLALVGG